MSDPTPHGGATAGPGAEACHHPRVVEVSVVVPSTGRAGLDRLVRSLAGAPGSEVLVVDNTPGGTIGSVPPARVVREVRTGAATARNRGLEEAAGRVVVFVDDDVEADATTVAALARPVLDGHAGAAVGRVRLDPSVPLPRWLTPPLLGYLSNHDRGDRGHVVEPDDHGLSAAMAVDRALLQRVGGFWEALGPRPGRHLTNDDVQVCRALHRAGAVIRYVPEAAVVHQVPPVRLRRRAILARAFHQGRSDWLLEAGWEGRAAAAVLVDGAIRLGRALWGNARRLGRGPGTAERVAAELSRAGGLLAGAVLDRRPGRAGSAR